ncbi:hypothetical protein, conserved [Babesia ovata]|uniref:C3H1-type domain-containing protein n=1 Tax=Babesia ovata TaxID=189622 RepID=A0A2H6KJQ5_9APIC|nr:uncharacterized protein BOVATA_047150 [Babesia ovata]GBE63222.1 hypothetical protein, conserved [Babesia ovata]
MTQISDGKSTLEREIEALKNDKLAKKDDTPVDPSKLEKLAKLSSQLTSLETLQKLEKYSKELENDKNSKNPKDILDKLVEGLQSFLGFNSESKGYSGTGIVYSDLDRLCDGVMAFLHGVLESIKEDESVKKYDVQDASSNITSVINTLNTSVGKGREAFGDAVTEVSEWLKKHGEQVDKATGEVKTKLGDGNEYYKEVENEATKPLASQLAAWTGTLSKISSALNDDIQTKANDLDSALKGRIDVEMKPVTKVVEHLQSVAVDKGFKDQVSKVDEELRETFSKVIERILNLKHEKYTHFKGMRKTLEVAEQELLGEEGINFNNKYKQHIMLKFKGIQHQMNDLYHHLMGKKMELSGLVSSAQAAFGTIKVKVGKAGGRDGENIKSVAFNWDKLKVEVQTFVNGKIVGTDDGSQGLKQIKEGILKYAKGFGKGGTFETTVLKDWIQGIMEKEPTRRYITSMSSANSEDITKVHEGIIGQIKDIVSKVSGKRPDGNGSVDGNLGYIRKFLESVADELEKKLTSAEVSKIITTIDPTLAHPSSSYKKDHLSKVLQIILRRVSDMAKHVAAEIKRFTEESKIEHLANIMTQATSLPDMLNGQGDSNRGDKITKALGVVSRQITALDTLLEGVGSKIPDAVGTIQEIIDEVAKLQNGKADNDVSVEKMKNDVEAKMDNLKAEMQEKFKAINQDVRIAHDTLKQAIDSLHDAVKTAQNTVTTEVRKLFCRQHLADLEALHKLANEQKAIIQNIITLDSMTGVKGLMNLMETQHQKIYQIPVIREFKDVTENVRDYLNKILLYTSSQSHSPQVDRLKSQLDTLLTNLKLESSTKISHFDHTFTSDLAALNDALAALTPKQFNGHQHPELLDALAAGAKRLAEELGKQYVNRYSGLKWSEQADTDKDKCAKVLLTLLYTVSNSLSTLKHDCRTLKGEQINQSSNVGKLLAGHGYIVSEYGKQDGQLRNKKECNGQHIIDLLIRNVDGANENEHLKTCKDDAKNKSEEKHKVVAPKTHFNVMDLLACLTTHRNEYFQTCHLSTSFAKKHPCSVNEMLCWLSGLPHNHIYPKLKSHITSLFEVPDRSDPNVKTVQPVNAHPFSFTYRHVHDALKNMAAQSQNMLRIIRGTGNAQITYGCDFTNNSLSLSYPSNPGACFDTLYDILRRLFPVFKFLHIQCTYAGKDYGWRDCLYGNGVDPSSWQCRDHANTKPNGQATSQANCKPKDEPNGQPTCQPKSPLMSYLNDCLPGHLPHQLQSVGCTFKCTTCSPNAKGMPCLTPLGFRYFSGSMRTGRELCLLLDDICGNYGVLTGLLSMLTCVTVRPPQLFPDIFAFYSMLISKWDNAPNAQSKVDNKTIKGAISDSIDGTIACSTDDANKLLDPCGLLYQSNSHADHNLNNPDLKYLVGCGKQDCGTFMQPLSHSAYSIFAPRHASKYFSCLLYSGWSLVKFLEQLKDAFCSISCADAGCLPCVNTNQCQQGKHGSAECGCMSMVNCKGVSSVFYQYGLTYANAPAGTRKKCKYFCDTIDRILSSKLLGNFLSAIDELIFTVRENFIWTLVALWSLSLLYLLHIAVVRLDVLRIRSHLRSPASHRIAAQSLLAAARVKALANVKYFSP